MRFAGVHDHDVKAEDPNALKWCIENPGRQRQYLQAMNTRSAGHGMHPDLSSGRWPFARSPIGPPQPQLWDVKVLGVISKLQP